MHIVNIIGMSDRRVSNLNINIIEQNASPNMASIRGQFAADTQWIGKCQCHLVEIVNFV